MGNNNKTKLSIQTSNEYYVDPSQYDSKFFHRFIDSKMKESCNLPIGPVKTRTLAKYIGIDYEVFRKILNKQKPTKKRDCIIAICIMLALSKEETNIALASYNAMKQLDIYDERDKAIIDVIESINADPPEKDIFKLTEINDELRSRGASALDVHNFKNSNSNSYVDFPFEIKEKKLRIYTDTRLSEYDLLLLYDSIENEYKTKLYNYTITAVMILKNNDNEYFKLITDGTYYETIEYYDNEKKNSNYCESINDTGAFKACYEEMKIKIINERKRLYSILFDSKNYRECITAKVINNELHVFYETYNYRLPALNEYYLMDYVNGCYTFSVSNKSRFMQMCLPEEEYLPYIGRVKNKILETYHSVEEIQRSFEKKHDEFDYEYNESMETLKRIRIIDYKECKNKIDNFIDDLKSERKIIRNFEATHDCPYDALEYYEVTDEFKCTFDPDFDAISGIGVERAWFSLSDNRKVEISFEELIMGFKLGLSTIEEIGNFLLKNKTLKINELL